MCSARLNCRRTNQRTDGSSFATTSDRTDGSSPGGATTNHDRGALALPFAGCHCRRSLNFIVLTVDSNAPEPEAQRGASLEAAGRLRIIHDPLCASTFGDGDLAFHLNRGFDSR